MVWREYLSFLDFGIDVFQDYPKGGTIKPVRKSIDLLDISSDVAGPREIVFLLSGSILMDGNGCWTFGGTVSAENDKFDFNPKNWGARDSAPSSRNIETLIDETMRPNTISFKINELSSKLWIRIGWVLLCPCATMFFFSTIGLKRIILGLSTPDCMLLSVLGAIGVCLVSVIFFVFLMIHNVYTTFCRLEFEIQSEHLVRSVLLGRRVVCRKQWNKSEIVDVYTTKLDDIGSVGSFNGNVLAHEEVVPEYRVFLQTKDKTQQILSSEFPRHAALCKLFLSELIEKGETF